MEAIRKTVSSVIGEFDAMSASPCPWKGLEGSVADDAHRQTDSRVAVQVLPDSGLQLNLVDPDEPVIRRPDRRLVE